MFIKPAGAFKSIDDLKNSSAARAGELVVAGVMWLGMHELAHLKLTPKEWVAVLLGWFFSGVWGLGFALCLGAGAGWAVWCPGWLAALYFISVTPRFLIR